jgi:hypothetical protein
MQKCTLGRAAFTFRRLAWAAWKGAPATSAGDKQEMITPKPPLPRPRNSQPIPPHQDQPRQPQQDQQPHASTPAALTPKLPTPDHDMTTFLHYSPGLDPDLP